MGTVKIVKDISITPSTEFIVVKVDQEEAQKTAGGILIPQLALQNKKTMTGVVVSVGPGRKDANGVHVPAVDVKVGDRVLFACFIGYPLVLGEKGEHVLIKHGDVMGWVAEDAEYVEEDAVPSNLQRDADRVVA